MELLSRVLLWKLVLLQSSAVLLSSGPVTAGSSVVSESAVSWAVGTQAVLRCQSPRMVWTQDRLHDRQRVVHWDLSSGSGSPGRRLVDMYSAGEQRVYEPHDHDRLLLSPSAFHDGNFSLLIRAVGDSDEGLYTCNLHHHYCHLYESLAIRLEVTDDPRAARAYWDGEKEVLVAARGAPALLTCVNRAHVWTDRHLEEAQQVVHWDRQPPGVPHDRADRLLDLYASGERRAYGPPFLRDRVAVGADAFARGDFSLRIGPLEPADEGTYSCHLHHHYCGLHERRVFHLRVTEPLEEPPPRTSPGNGSGSGHSSAPAPDPTLSRGRSVINVIVPEGRAQFFQQLGYVLATLLLFILLLITVVLATRQRRRGGEKGHPTQEPWGAATETASSGRGEAPLNSSLPPQATNTRTRSRGSQRGECPPPGPHTQPAPFLPKLPPLLPRKDMNMAEFTVATGDQALYRTEDIQLGRRGWDTEAHTAAPTLSPWASLGRTSSSSLTPDYKNNILKERAELAHNPLPAKNIDLDKEFRKEYCK
uniref:Matrix remodeling-associated protein 8 n=1 Tax=Castor canadensis TaxID=51338 RepID=A0A8B7TUQ6_CASCN|nr:matrix-remodeling-associated protein 8 isoform X2 [Castor canadensis]